MELTCQLKGDYRDIPMLRKMKGWSGKELAEALYRTESYISQLESGKVQLKLSMYHDILKVLGFELTIQTKINPEIIFKQTQTKGQMHMKNSQRELAKQMILSYMVERQGEWSVEGLLACQALVDLMDEKHPQLIVRSSDYAVYDGTDGGVYTRIGERFELDIDLLVEEVLNDIVRLFEDDWSIPTKEGVRLDLYHLIY